MSGTVVSNPNQPTAGSWRALRTKTEASLVDTRLQVHHATQLATALGISYLPKTPDDSHTNLTWIDALSALVSNPVVAENEIRVGVSIVPFALLVIVNDGPRANLPLDGRTITEAAAWVREHLATLGLDATNYTLAKHYTIPDHAVGSGAPFDARDLDSFDEFARWYADASSVLEEFAAKTANAGTVRCWPHHFDIATLVELGPGKTVGLGMEPGDVYYAEPYFYASPFPRPRGDLARPPLAGNGRWHTHEWIGAVLPASDVGSVDQRSQIEAFLESALSASTGLMAAS